MAKPVVLPTDVVQVINMIKATYVDPNDFQNAVQECFNRGFGEQGQWIMDHKDLYLQALQDGYTAETDVPISEHTTPPPLPPVIDPPGAEIPTPPVETETEQSEEVIQENSGTEEGTGIAETPASDGSGEQPEGKKRKPK